MGREELEVLEGGVIRRKYKRVLGIFIDGVGLDRATRRLKRKVDLSRLISSICAGSEAEVSRYYTLVPHEDDARQFAFLEAVERAGLEVVLRRLPPRGIKRQVSTDVNMATDIISFTMGGFKSHSSVAIDQNILKQNGTDAFFAPKVDNKLISNPKEENIKRVVAVVCPSRELSYAMYVAHSLGAETSLIDFGMHPSTENWLGIDKWVDLSASETIWR